MVRLFIRHAVGDYQRWRQAYDANAARRPDLGVTGDAVHRGVDDENDVTVWHDFESLSAAQAFLELLPELMEEAGVTTGSAQTWLAFPT